MIESGSNSPPPKILFLVTEDWYFCSHRLAVACAARERGYRVAVATRIRNHGEAIARSGIKPIGIRLRRRSMNPFRELASLIEIFLLYRREKPDIVHHVALKPVLYGSVAALFSGTPYVINAIAGLGHIFSSKTLTAGLLKPFVRTAFRVLLNRRNSRVIVQNDDDRMFLIRSLGVDEKKIRLIRGAGVNLSLFKPTPEPSGEPVVTLAARLLRDKGIGEFVEAVGLLKAKGLRFRARVAGAPDPDSPGAVSQAELAEWRKDGAIEWLGHRSDMPQIWRETHIAVLPSSYGEGVPKALIEAAASGRAAVTTDMPGCRDIVRHGKNGLLVPARNASALADAIEYLIGHSAARQKMGKFA
ncbi:MAG: glycosyltransferase family 4 protein, partial [Gammaproteobacteria bacterium]